MEIYDLAIGYVWEFDKDFVQLLEQRFHNAGLSTYIIQEHNIKEVTEQVISKKLYFRFYFDRAWDVDDDFGKLGKILNRKHTYIFNAYKNVLHAIDKASMHLEFITNGINVPYSIIIPPVSEEEEIFISVDDLAKIGRPFIIKPCNTTGGGTGVVIGAESLKEVLHARKKYNDDKYLLQEKIIPNFIDGRRAWFRCFYAFGKIIPCWWDDLTHIYDIITEKDTELFNYKKLINITRTIYNITQLDFFSTEIAITDGNKFIVIDYVNDQCDLRSKAWHFDGIPQQVVDDIIANMIKSTLKIKKLLL
jgi:hypothetical protein